MKITTIYKDDSYAILAMADGHEKLVVQLVSYVPRMYPNPEGILEEHLAAKVIHTIEVKVMTNMVINTNVKQDLAAAIAQMNKQLALINQANEHLEGALKDYVNTSKQ